MYGNIFYYLKKNQIISNVREVRLQQLITYMNNFPFFVAIIIYWMYKANKILQNIYIVMKQKLQPIMVIMNKYPNYGSKILYH